MYFYVGKILIGGLLLSYFSKHGSFADNDAVIAHKPTCFHGTNGHRMLPQQNPFLLGISSLYFPLVGCILYNNGSSMYV